MGFHLLRPTEISSSAGDRIGGRLEGRWVDWFKGLTFTYEGDGTLRLYDSIPDQTVLHSILKRIRDMNLQLISVNKVEAHSKDESQTTTEGSKHFD